MCIINIGQMHSGHLRPKSKETIASERLTEASDEYKGDGDVKRSAGIVKRTPDRLTAAILGAALTAARLVELTAAVLHNCSWILASSEERCPTATKSATATAARMAVCRRLCSTSNAARGSVTCNIKEITTTKTLIQL